MPPTSVNIFEEGANIESFKIVDGGVFNSTGLYEHMVTKPAQYPGSSGCRNIRDVESDLKAVGSAHIGALISDSRVSAFSKSPRITKASNSSTPVCFVLSLDILGHQSTSIVVEDYGLSTVQEYMLHIRTNAELSVRNLLRDVVKRSGTNVLSAVDYLDDGSPVRPPASTLSEHTSHIQRRLDTALHNLSIDPTQR